MSIKIWKMGQIFVSSIPRTSESNILEKNYSEKFHWFSTLKNERPSLMPNSIKKSWMVSTAGTAVGLVSTARPRPPRLRRQPYFISVSPDQRISPGGSVKLKCIASGNPLPRLAWLLNGEVLVSRLKYLWRIYLLNTAHCAILQYS